MKRSTRNPRLARQTIIEKSAPIFNQYGYSGTRMDMLIEATGYQKGGIYKHFSSKMDLAKAAFQHNYEKLKAGYLEKIMEEATPKAKLIAFVDNYQDFIKFAPVKGGCPILNTAIEADDANEDMRLLALEALEDWTKILSKIIRDGQKNGTFLKQEKPKVIAQFIISIVEGAIMMGKLKRDKKLMQNVGHQMMNYIELAIFKD